MCIRDMTVPVARRCEARDRHRHVRAQHELVALLVVDPIPGFEGVVVGHLERLRILKPGCAYLPVPVGLEAAAQCRLDGAQLAALRRQDVAHALWDHVVPSPPSARPTSADPDACLLYTSPSPRDR